MITMKTKTTFVLAMVAVLTLSGVAAGLGAHTDADQVGVVGDVDQPEVTALAGPVAENTDSASFIAGSGEEVNRPGVAVAYRMATDNGLENLTLVGEDVGSQYTYFANVENQDGEALYSPYGLSVDGVDNMSVSLVEDHFQSAGTVVVANPDNARDYIVGSAHARDNSYPMLYADPATDMSMINDTLQELGTSTVIVTTNVDDESRSVLNDTYSVSEISTDAGAEALLTEADGTADAYIVEDMPTAVYAGSAVSDDVIVQLNESIDTQTASYLSTNDPDTFLVGSYSDEYVNDVENATAGTVTQIDADSPDVVMSRLTLHEQGSTIDPLVSVSDTTTYEDNGTNVVETDVTNLGFATGENVVIELERDSDAEYSFETEPADDGSEDGNITWTEDVMEDGETVTIKYSVSGAGEAPIVPHVVSYDNTAGSSLGGITILQQANEYISGAIDQIHGVIGTLGAVKATALNNPIKTILLALGGIGLGGAVLLLNRSDNK